MVIRGSDGLWKKPERSLRYYYHGTSVTEEVAYLDIDQNVERLMGAVIRSGDIGEPLFEGFVKALSGVGCEATGRCLVGGEIRLTLTLGPQAVTISVPVLEGTAGTNPTCNTPTFQGEMKQWTRTLPWKIGEDVLLNMGSSSLMIRHSPSVALGHPGSGPNAPWRPSFGTGFFGREGFRVDVAGRTRIVTAP